MDTNQTTSTAKQESGSDEQVLHFFASPEALLAEGQALKDAFDDLPRQIGRVMADDIPTILAPFVERFSCFLVSCYCPIPKDQKALQKSKRTFKAVPSVEHEEIKRRFAIFIPAAASWFRFQYQDVDDWAGFQLPDEKKEIISICRHAFWKAVGMQFMLATSVLARSDVVGEAAEAAHEILFVIGDSLLPSHRNEHYEEMFLQAMCFRNFDLLWRVYEIAKESISNWSRGEEREKMSFADASESSWHHYFDFCFAEGAQPSFEEKKKVMKMVMALGAQPEVVLSSPHGTSLISALFEKEEIDLWQEALRCGATMLRSFNSSYQEQRLKNKFLETEDPKRRHEVTSQFYQMCVAGMVDRQLTRLLLETELWNEKRPIRRWARAKCFLKLCRGNHIAQHEDFRAARRRIMPRIFDFYNQWAQGKDFSAGTDMAVMRQFFRDLYPDLRIWFIQEGILNLNDITARGTNFKKKWDYFFGEEFSSPSRRIKELAKGFWDKIKPGRSREEERA